MNIIYDDKVKKLFEDPRKLQKAIGLDLARKTIRIINMLKAIDDFKQYINDVRIGKPHELEGDLNKYFSISVSANYRLIVKPLKDGKDEKIFVKGVLDYHGGKNEWIVP
ncbi:MAG: type II toxin-antitoxin system RelE/ParE family toxin [Clostridia bacterium]|nr:type II toxin-antitoxin system RelE/ParE family toxin [Clostridia bacterium]